jgi:hypothetical protein
MKLGEWEKRNSNEKNRAFIAGFKVQYDSYITTEES